MGSFTLTSFDLGAERKNQKIMSKAMVLVRVLMVICLVELGIMLFFSAVNLDIDPVYEALLDSAMLGSISTPFILYWVIRPFVQARDVAEAHVRYLALHDPLTRLPNRRLLEEILSNSTRLCTRDNVFGACLLIDLDGFKPINDKFGHNGGDFVLIKTAKRLRQTLRKSDFVARLGGDEFVVVLVNVGSTRKQAQENSIRTAESIRGALGSTIEFNGNSLIVEASIGIRLFDAGGAEVELLLRDADSAMYDAKKAGRARALLFNDDPKSQGLTGS